MSIVKKKTGVLEDRNAETLNQQKKGSNVNGSERKGAKKGSEEKMWRQGEGRWLLVCRGLAAFDGEKKTLERQWLETPLSPSLSVSLPLSSCDCCRLQGEGSHLCRLSDGWLQHVRSYMCACAWGQRDSKRVKVQMRSFIISIQSQKKTLQWTTLSSTRNKGCYSSHITPSPLDHLMLVMKQRICDIIGRHSVVYYGDSQKCLFHCFEKF